MPRLGLGFLLLAELTLIPDWHACLKCPGFPHLFQVWFGPGNLNHGPFGTLFGLNKFLNVIEGGAGLEVIVGGVFLYDVFRYGGILRSMHQGVHYHLIYVGVAVLCRTL